MARTRLTALLATLALTACASAPPVGRQHAVVLGGYDAPGDADQVYVQHPGWDGRRLTLTVLVLPEDWRSRERVPRGDGTWELVEPLPLREVPLEFADPAPEPDPEVRGMPFHWSRWKIEPWLAVVSPYPREMLLASPDRPAGYVSAHRYRQEGRDVVVVYQREEGSTVELEVFGTDGWPLELVHLGTWRAELPPLAGIDPELGRGQWWAENGEAVTSALYLLDLCWRFR